MTALTDPRTLFREGGFPGQGQQQPGLTGETTPAPDHGERSYTGHGRLKGRRALITGGDSGIGRAVAIAYAREGAKVAISYLPEEEADAQETARLINEAGETGLLLPGDLRNEQYCAEIVHATVAAFGGIDLLVLNAAYQRDRTSIGDTPTDEIRRVIATNLEAPIYTLRAAESHLPPGASVIFSSSVQGYEPSEGLFDYAMTKAALVSLTESMAKEFGPKGVRVNAVAPGPVWTPLIPATGWDEEKLASFGQDTPLGRAGQPAELAGAYVYLASDDASYTTGAIIAVTGGKNL
ncbi:SDR family oxidoreductase [Pseudoclavibacter sp. 8L]|uniref:SDR family oxidoreductase n=1 Tax=Pseudoclavibacter sp. 8L TaxID=2653162 RepID=UPI0012F12D95|nr:SDR family oxidoreductase [Pseudoclavibacter sp. 8L]VXB51574.1 putative oxidoreductase [Pseudoclavibacter sp. 8L]